MYFRVCVSGGCSVRQDKLLQSTFNSKYPNNLAIRSDFLKSILEFKSNKRLFMMLKDIDNKNFYCSNISGLHMEYIISVIGKRHQEWKVGWGIEGKWRAWEKQLYYLCLSASTLELCLCIYQNKNFHILSKISVDRLQKFRQIFQKVRTCYASELSGAKEGARRILIQSPNEVYHLSILYLFKKRIFKDVMIITFFFVICINIKIYS